MVYTVKKQCVEEPDILYEDGIKKIFLYTKGTEGNPSQELREMLKYIENSIAKNVTNREIEEIHNYVNEIKRDRKTGIQYIKGRQQINTLYRKLAERGRTEDVIKASSDMEYQKKLLTEFAIDI